ncbi:MAG: hypothetical protein L3J75_15970 [Methylococcaceae bacterium]|nr:hypothetical protein [Methylococcaceae bacterium]
MSKLPIYNEENPLIPGLYLGLFHGRDDPDKTIDDWGTNGPIIGPLKHVHTTYATHIKLEFCSQDDIRKYSFNPDSMIDLDIDAGMVVFQDIWYGDWTVFYYEAA